MILYKSAGLIAGLCMALYGEAYCSLRVHVIEQNNEQPGTMITVSDSDGRRVQKRAQTNGAEFCDLGFSPVTVEVGGPWCNQVTVRHVPLEWGKTTTLRVLHDRTACTDESAPVAACQILLRVGTAGGEAVKGAALSLLAPRIDLLWPDEYGRILLRIAAGQRVEGTVAAQGFKTTTLNVPCVPANRRAEHAIVLYPGP